MRRNRRERRLFGRAVGEALHEHDEAIGRIEAGPANPLEAALLPRRPAPRAPLRGKRGDDGRA